MQEYQMLSQVYLTCFRHTTSDKFIEWDCEIASSVKINKCHL